MRKWALSLALLALCSGVLSAQATRIISSGTLPTCSGTGTIYIKTGSSSGWYICLVGSWIGPFVPPGPITTSGLTQATNKLLGRTTAGTGAIEEISVGSGLTLSAGSLSASGSGTVTTTGSPTSGQLAMFSGATSITSAASVAVTTSGLTQATAKLLGRTTSSTGAIEEITVGSGLTFSAGSLSVNGGAAVTFSGARIHRTTLQSLNNGSVTAISFDAESYDTGSYHEGVTNPTRITIPSTGKYHVGATVETSGSPGATSYIAIRLNGSTIIAWQQLPNDGGAAIASISTDYGFTASDYVEFLVKVNAASKDAIVADGVDPAMWIHLIGS